MNKQLRRKHRWVMIGLVLLLLVFVVISINAGYSDIAINEIIKVLLGQGTDQNTLIITQFRLPRIVISVLVGIGFALSGCVLQGLVKNPLADPGLIGINAGAGIIVLIVVALSGSLSISSIFALPILSLIGALCVGIMIYRLSLNEDGIVNPSKLILNGIAIQAGINAIMTVIITKLDDTQYDFVATWQAGSIWNSNWQFVLALTPWIIFGFTYLMIKAKNLDIMVMGDDIGLGLGLKVKQDKAKLLFTSTALAAASVAISGSMSFIGLIAPHIARKLVGHRHRILLIACALVGADLVLIADTIARTIIEPAEIPTGIVVSTIGAPYFIFLLISQRKTQKG